MQYADSDQAAGYDVIGDVHGCAHTLERLLELMGYRKQAGVYCHPGRQAIFIGDIIDRGPRIREALHLVYDMVERGSAQVIMGNHEYNVLAYCTPARPGSGRTYLREHTPRHNRLIAETMEQLGPYPGDFHDFLGWFSELPLLLEFSRFRVVHACWDTQLIPTFLADYPTGKMDDDFLHQSADIRTFPGRVVDRLTRGVDLALPEGMVIKSGDGYERRFFRTAFWIAEPQTYGDVVFQPDPLPTSLCHRVLSSAEREHLCYYDPEQPPLFFGHYWRSGRPGLIRPNIACIDYSAVKYGKLVAYRMGRENVLDPGKFVWVDVDRPELQAVANSVCQ